MKLREARKQANMSQTELAERIGSHQDVISYIERGMRSPTAKTRRNIEKALKTDIDWINTRLKGEIWVNIIDRKPGAKELVSKAIFNYIKDSITIEERQSKAYFLKQLINNI